MKSLLLISALAVLPQAANATGTWTRLAPAHQPSARLGMASAYDPVSHRLVLFGGFDGSAYFADTWVFDGSDWSKLSPPAAPPVRTNAGMAYDAVSRKLILFGGYDGNNWLGDTWAYDGASGTWQPMQPQHPPRAGTGPAVFSDPASGHAIVYGGFDGSQTIGYSNQTLRWTGSDWTQLTVTPPSARSDAGYANDPSTRSVVLFGGLGSVNPYNSWTWHTHSWTQRTPSQMPPMRFAMGIACDAGLSGCVLLGGDQGGLSVGDSWLWNGATAQWSAFSATGSPGPRESFTMAYYPPAKEIIVFGGLRALTHKSSLLNDTWALR